MGNRMLMAGRRWLADLLGRFANRHEGDTDTLWYC